MWQVAETGVPTTLTSAPNVLRQKLMVDSEQRRGPTLLAYLERAAVEVVAEPSHFMPRKEGRPIAVANGSCCNLFEVVTELAQSRSLVLVREA